MTQRERVIAQLTRANALGVHSFWGYRNYIPRMGAIIHDLRHHEGFEIISIDNKTDAGCTYIMISNPLDDSYKIRKMTALDHIKFALFNK